MAASSSADVVGVGGKGSTSSTVSRLGADGALLQRGERGDDLRVEVVEFQRTSESESLGCLVDVRGRDDAEEEGTDECEEGGRLAHGSECVDRGEGESRGWVEDVEGVWVDRRVCGLKMMV